MMAELSATLCGTCHPHTVKCEHSSSWRHGERGCAQCVCGAILPGGCVQRSRTSPNCSSLQKSISWKDTQLPIICKLSRLLLTFQQVYRGPPIICDVLNSSSLAVKSSTVICIRGLNAEAGRCSWAALGLGNQLSQTLTPGLPGKNSIHCPLHCPLGVIALILAFILCYYCSQEYLWLIGILMAPSSMYQCAPGTLWVSILPPTRPEASRTVTWKDKQLFDELNGTCHVPSVQHPPPLWQTQIYLPP